MASTTLRGQRPPVVESATPKFKPVKLWAALGVGWLAMITISMARWILGGHAHSIPAGADHPETYMLIFIRAQELIFGVIAVWAIYHCLVRPWRKEGRLTQDGVILLGAGSLWMQDPMCNYFRQYFAYNSGALNLGCPQCYMPGYRGIVNFAEPLWIVFFYWGAAWGFIKIACWFASKIHQRWPQRPVLTPLLTLFVFSAVFDILIEGFWVRTGTYAMFGMKDFALFGGHFYQFPWYQSPLSAAWFLGLAIWAYFKNDKGEMLCERGYSSLRASPKQKGALRVLAFIGAINTAAFFLNSLPLGVITLDRVKTVKDVYSRSYFTQKSCGPGTTRACPDYRIPSPMDSHSFTVTPEGQLVGPNGEVVGVQKGAPFPQLDGRPGTVTGGGR